MKGKRYKGICIIDSVYTFFVFLLVNYEEYRDFFYVFWVNSPQNIVDSVPNKIKLNDAFNNNGNPRRFFHNWCCFFRFYYLLTKYHLWGIPACGQDHLPFSRYLINYSNIEFEEYEDGLASYLIKDRTISYKWIRKISAANSEPSFGYSKNVKKIYLTSPLLSISEEIRDKVEYVDLDEKWKSLSYHERESICGIFNYDLKIPEDKDCIIILTRPFSEEKMCSEDQKIDQVRRVLEGIKGKGEHIIIKPHYRETTDYHSFFPDVTVARGSFPIELMLLANSSNIKKIVTFGHCSSELFINQFMSDIDYICV